MGYPFLFSGVPDLPTNNACWPPLAVICFALAVAGLGLFHGLEYQLSKRASQAVALKLADEKERLSKLFSQPVDQWAIDDVRIFIKHARVIKVFLNMI